MYEQQAAEHVRAVTRTEYQSDESQRALAELRERLQSVTGQLRAAEEQFETEQVTASDLQDSLSRSENRERALMEELEAKDVELQRQSEEVEREREAMELRRYRALEVEREKWEELMFFKKSKRNITSSISYNILFFCRHGCSFSCNSTMTATSRLNNAGIQILVNKLLY